MSSRDEGIAEPDSKRSDSFAGNRLLLHDSFRSTIEALRKAKIRLPFEPTDVRIDFSLADSQSSIGLVQNLEGMKTHKLDAVHGEKVFHGDKLLIAAYDESFNRFAALEGNAVFTSHSLLLVDEEKYVPLNLLTMYFYTKSRDLHEKAPFIKFTEDPESDWQKDYLKDKVDFILSNVPENSVLFIDGPLIAGDIYTTFLTYEKDSHQKGILPVFFVKNSSSNMVIDNTEGLKSRFNSDLHWSFDLLEKGERTSFFRYTDRNSARNTKVFCYLKTHDVSPQRIEFFTRSYEEHYNSIGAIMDLTYYLMLAQGNPHNPQVRPIAIAEKYARETLRLVDFNRTMRRTGIQPTMNQERFGWVAQ